MGDIQFNGTPEEWDALVKKNKEQETLEEAAENRTLKCIPSDYFSFIAGATWQAERMYTYDELRKIAYNAFCLGQMDNPTENKFNGWIEQFKK